MFVMFFFYSLHTNYLSLLDCVEEDDELAVSGKDVEREALAAFIGVALLLDGTATFPVSSLKSMYEETI